jgi:hypothetical protein
MRPLYIETVGFPVVFSGVLSGNDVTPKGFSRVCPCATGSYEKKKNEKKSEKKENLMRPLYIETVTSLDKCTVTFYWVT